MLLNMIVKCLFIKFETIKALWPLKDIYHVQPFI